MVTINPPSPPVSPSRHIVPNTAAKRACSLPQSTSHLRRRRALTTTFTTVPPPVALPQDPFGPRGFNARAICKHCAEVYRPEFSPCAPHCSIDCRTMDKLYTRHIKSKLSAAEHADTEHENEENTPNTTDPASQQHHAPESGSDPRLPSPPNLDPDASPQRRAQSAPSVPSGTTTTNSSTGHPRSNPKSPKTSGLSLMLSKDNFRRSETDKAAIMLSELSADAHVSLAPPAPPASAAVVEQERP
mmetsp:Transcript_107334/g.311853  ORF Transcript_107334/g.311853 Transcript_107334/m.311853 type:complete len:244 (+) Transcript_107334:209-940(+)